MITTLAKPTLMLLSSMISMSAPGNSVFSRVMLESCDTECQTQRLCDEGFSWKCDPPKFEKWRHKELLDQLLEGGDEPTGENYVESMKQFAFSRPETYEEGLERYVVIAQAAYEISRERSANTADEEDKKYCNGWSNYSSERCTEARKARPWKWAPDELMYLLTITAQFESGFRRDVHSGLGESAKGDCSWYFADGRPARPMAKGAERVCKSNCLNQIKLEVVRAARGDKRGQMLTVSGFAADEIVGIDLDSTKRCFHESAAILARSRGWCTSSASGAKKEDWVESTLTAYGTGNTCIFYSRNKDGSMIKDKDNNPIRSDKFKRRADVFNYWFNNRKDLKPGDQEILGRILEKNNTKTAMVDSDRD